MLFLENTFTKFSTNSICNNKLHLYSSHHFQDCSKHIDFHIVWKDGKGSVYVFTGEPVDHSVQDFSLYSEEMEPVITHILRSRLDIKSMSRDSQAGPLYNAFPSHWPKDRGQE